MMKTNLFSVLIAQYNNAKYLQEAIDSVKAQTYRNWEIILVDDASTDSSTDLYKLYENDDRIKIFYNKENKGCGYTKRLCIEFAKGEICGFLDPDDALEPEALDLMTNEHLRDKNISLIYSRYIVCDENLNKKYISQCTKKISNDNDYLHSARYIISHFVSFKKNLYNKTEGINPLLKRAVDQDLYLKLEEIGSLVFIDKPLYLYRIHKGGISAYDNNYKAFYWHIKVVDAACYRRRILYKSEDIVAEMIRNNFSRTSTVINNPSLKDVLKCIYRYIKKKLDIVSK